MGHVCEQLYKPPSNESTLHRPSAASGEPSRAKAMQDGGGSIVKVHYVISALPHSFSCVPLWKQFLPSSQAAVKISAECSYTGGGNRWGSVPDSGFFYRPREISSMVSLLFPLDISQS